MDDTGLEPVTPCTSRNVGWRTQVSFFSEQLRLNGFSVLERLKLYKAWIFTAILRPTNNASSYYLMQTKISQKFLPRRENQMMQTIFTRAFP
nr:hypothetical protein [uncultured Oscillibacter sp.]